MNEQQYQARITELEKENAALKSGDKISITQIGIHTPRDGLGNFIAGKAVNIYALTTELIDAGIAPEPQDDNKAITDIAGLFCKKHKAYLEAAKAAERENALRPRTIPPDAETPEDIPAALIIKHTPEDIPIAVGTINEHNDDGLVVKIKPHTPDDAA